MHPSVVWHAQRQAPRHLCIAVLLRQTQAQAQAQHAMPPPGVICQQQLTNRTIRSHLSAPRVLTWHRPVAPTAAADAGLSTGERTRSSLCSCTDTCSSSSRSTVGRRRRQCGIGSTTTSSATAQARQHLHLHTHQQQQQRRRQQQQQRHMCHAWGDWGEEGEPHPPGQVPPDPWAATPNTQNPGSSPSSSGRGPGWQPGPGSAGPRVGWRPTPSSAGPGAQNPNPGRWGGWGWRGGNGSNNSSSSSGRSSGPGANSQPPGSSNSGPGSYTSTSGGPGGAGYGTEEGSGMEGAAFQNTDWGWYGPEDWDPADGLDPGQLMDLENEYEEEVIRRRELGNAPRDKWITPLLDLQSIIGAFDPDQSRTEDSMKDEALTNKEESQEAIAFAARLVFIPLLTGALIGRTLTDPVLNFTLANNPAAFAMTSRQEVEGATRVHMEEARVRMDIAIGRAPPIDETEMLRHLRHYALEVVEEERQRNESNLMTLVSDSISSMLLFFILARDVDGRSALFNTFGRLFQGLSDIAKAVLIILVADTMLGYHSEEGWTGFIDVVLGHYGIEGNEEGIVVFVGIIPVAIDVLFKYWVFTGLNKISPGAVVTIKQIDRH